MRFISVYRTGVLLALLPTWDTAQAWVDTLGLSDCHFEEVTIEIPACQMPSRSELQALDKRTPVSAQRAQLVLRVAS